jgi:hypothetical protein
VAKFRGGGRVKSRARTGTVVMWSHRQTVIHLKDRKPLLNSDKRHFDPPLYPTMRHPLYNGGGATVVLLLVASAATAQSGSMPRELGNALDARYPGWRLATTTGFPNERQWVRGDFDGDGRAEYAVQIVRAAQDGGVRDDRRQLVLVAWRGRGDRSRAFDFTIVREEAVSELTYLALARRGERVPDLDADENGTRSYRLARDGIHILYGEVAGTTCQLTPNVSPRRFQCRTSGD